MTVIASRPDAARRRPRPSLAARKSGYVVAALVNAAMLYGVNRWPGWDVVPFLTEETEDVLPAVNASILAGLVANLLYLVRDPEWFRALGDVVTTSVGLFAMTRLWVVFPVDFAEGGFDWALVTRILLGLGIAGCIVGVLAGLVRLGRALALRKDPPRTRGRPSRPHGTG